MLYHIAVRSAAFLNRSQLGDANEHTRTVAAQCATPPARSARAVARTRETRPDESARKRARARSA
eukprot:5257039-Pleurochrysis_carterae.AAC.1